MKTSKSIFVATWLVAALIGCQQPVKTDQEKSMSSETEEIPMAMLEDI